MSNSALYLLSRSTGPICSNIEHFTIDSGKIYRAYGVPGGEVLIQSLQVDHLNNFKHHMTTEYVLECPKSLLTKIKNDVIFVSYNCSCSYLLAAATKTEIFIFSLKNLLNLKNFSPGQISNKASKTYHNLYKLLYVKEQNDITIMSWTHSGEDLIIVDVLGNVIAYKVRLIETKCECSKSTSIKDQNCMHNEKIELTNVWIFASKEKWNLFSPGYSSSLPCAISSNKRYIVKILLPDGTDILTSDLKHPNNILNISWSKTFYNSIVTGYSFLLTVCKDGILRIWANNISESQEYLGIGNLDSQKKIKKLSFVVISIIDCQIPWRYRNTLCAEWIYLHDKKHDEYEINWIVATFLKPSTGKDCKNVSFYNFHDNLLKISNTPLNFRSTIINHCSMLELDYCLDVNNADNNNIKSYFLKYKKNILLIEGSWNENLNLAYSHVSLFSLYVNYSENLIKQRIQLEVCHMYEIQGSNSNFRKLIMHPSVDIVATISFDGNVGIWDLWPVRKLLEMSSFYLKMGNNIIDLRWIDHDFGRKKGILGVILVLGSIGIAAFSIEVSQKLVHGNVSVTSKKLYNMSFDIILNDNKILFSLGEPIKLNVKKTMYKHYFLICEYDSHLCDKKNNDLLLITLDIIYENLININIIVTKFLQYSYSSIERCYSNDLLLVFSKFSNSLSFIKFDLNEKKFLEPCHELEFPNLKSDKLERISMLKCSRKAPYLACILEYQDSFKLTFLQSDSTFEDYEYQIDYYVLLNDKPIDMIWIETFGVLLRLIVAFKCGKIEIYMCSKNGQWLVNAFYESSLMITCISSTPLGLPLIGAGQHLLLVSNMICTSNTLKSDSVSILQKGFHLGGYIKDYDSRFLLVLLMLGMNDFLKEILFSIINYAIDRKKNCEETSEKIASTLSGSIVKIEYVLQMKMFDYDFDGINLDIFKEVPFSVNCESSANDNILTFMSKGSGCPTNIFSQEKSIMSKEKDIFDKKKNSNNELSSQLNLYRNEIQENNSIASRSKFDDNSIKCHDYELMECVLLPKFYLTSLPIILNASWNAKILEEILGKHGELSINTEKNAIKLVDEDYFELDSFSIYYKHIEEVEYIKNKSGLDCISHIFINAYKQSLEHIHHCSDIMEKKSSSSIISNEKNKSLIDTNILKNWYSNFKNWSSSIGLFDGLEAIHLFWAIESKDKMYLLEYCIKCFKNSGKYCEKSTSNSNCYEKFEYLSWSHLKSMGISFWNLNSEDAKKIAEELVKYEYKINNDPIDVALFYIALKKIRILTNLLRKAGLAKVGDLIGRDFSLKKNKEIAAKNAYVLLGQHKYKLAASLFLASGHVEDGISVCAREMKDPQLAYFIAILLYDSHPHLKNFIIEKELIPSARNFNDKSAEAILLWLSGKYFQALEKIIEPACSLDNNICLKNNVKQCLIIKFYTSVVLTKFSNKYFPVILLEKFIDHIFKCIHIWNIFGMTIISLKLLNLVENLCISIKKRNHNKIKNLQTRIITSLMTRHFPSQEVIWHAVESRDHALILWHQHMQNDMDILLKHGYKIDIENVIQDVHNIMDNLFNIPMLPLLPKSHTHQPELSSLSTINITDSYMETTDHHMLIHKNENHLSNSVLNESFDTSIDNILSLEPLDLLHVDGDKCVGLCSSHCNILLDESHPITKTIAVATGKHGIHYVEWESHLLDATNIENKKRHPLSFLSYQHTESIWPSVNFLNSISEYYASINCDVNVREMHMGPMKSHPTLPYFLSGGYDKLFHLWKFGLNIPTISFSYSNYYEKKYSETGYVRRFAWNSSGDRLAAITTEGECGIWRLDSASSKITGGQADWIRKCAPKKGYDIDFLSGSGSIIISAGEDEHGHGLVYLWDLLAPSKVSKISHLEFRTVPREIISIPGSLIFLSAHDSGNIQAHDLRMLGMDKPKILWSLNSIHDGVVSKVEIGWSPSKRNNWEHIVATSGKDGDICLINNIHSVGKLRQRITKAHWKKSGHIATMIISGLKGNFGQISVPHHGTKRYLPENAFGTPVLDMDWCDEGLISAGADGIVQLFQWQYNKN